MHNADTQCTVEKWNRPKDREIFSMFKYLCSTVKYKMSFTLSSVIRANIKRLNLL